MMLNKLLYFAGSKKKSLYTAADAGAYKCAARLSNLSKGWDLSGPHSQHDHPLTAERSSAKLNTVHPNAN